jgi:alpha-amylase
VEGVEEGRERAFEDWKKANPAKKLGDLPFYMTAEVYNYGIRHGRAFDLGGLTADYPAEGFDSMINFTMKTDAAEGYEKLFSDYSRRCRDR